jgi:hypothetical protein
MMLGEGLSLFLYYKIARNTMSQQCRVLITVSYYNSAGEQLRANPEDYDEVAVASMQVQISGDDARVGHDSESIQVAEGCRITFHEN